MNSDFKVKIQIRAATQTDKFEYLCKETVVQPSTEEYFVKNEDRVRFYTGLPGFDHTVLLARSLIKRAIH